MMPPPAINTNVQAPGSPRRGAASLIVGSALVALILVANLAAYARTPERSNLDMQFAPPPTAAAQRLLWGTDARDAVSNNLGPLDTAFAKNKKLRFFSSVPNAFARTGRAYTYRPSYVAGLRNFAFAAGSAPPGLTVDSTTGAIGGSPTEPGKFEVVLSSTFQDTLTVEHRFSLFVADRALPLGTDQYGRDVVSVLLEAMKYTIVPGFIAVLIGVGGGTMLGALGAFYGGWLQTLLAAITTIIQSVPALLILCLIGAVSNYNVYLLMAVVGVILLPETANGIRETVESFRNRVFVEAARELGLRDRTILWNEIVWHNARAFLLTKVAQGFVYAILVDVTLNYMKLRSDSKLPKLGIMLDRGREEIIYGNTRLLAVASLATLMLVIAAFSMTERGILRRWERVR